MAAVGGYQNLHGSRTGQELARAELPHHQPFASTWQYQSSSPTASLVYSTSPLNGALSHQATPTSGGTVSSLLTTPSATGVFCSLRLTTVTTNPHSVNVTSEDLALQTSTNWEGNGEEKMTGHDNRKILAIVLGTVLPVVAVFSLAVYLWSRTRRRKPGVFKRGITPIGDDEIESWKKERDDEKDSIVLEGSERQHKHHRQDSAASITKPPSMIVYQNPGRSSGEELPHSPRSLHNYHSSIDMPPPVVFARAPNARPGLTDDMVQGDQAYIPKTKRHHSRLTKSISHTPRGHDRSRSARNSISTGTLREHWHGQVPSEYQAAPSQSAEFILKSPAADKPSHHRVFSSPANHPWRSCDEEIAPGGLSPRPQVHQSEIGRAIG